MSRTITFAPPLDDELVALGRRLLPAGFTLQVLSREELLAKLPEVELLLSMGVGWLSDEQLASATKLKLIQLMSVGYDSFNIEGARKTGIPVAINGGANAISVAEHAILFLLTLFKRLRLLDANVRSGKWRGGAMGALRIHEIWSQTIGIVGMGRIGQEVTKRLRPFEPGEIVYFDPVRLSAEREAQLGVRYLPLDELLKVADAVTLHVPLSDATRHMIDARSLALMKPSAVVINTARGGLIDEAALADALRSGRLAGAGLDVFSQEPPPADHPLLSLENVLLTPHLAGPTWESYPRRFENCFANLARVSRGEAPQWVIPELAELAVAR
jgi:glyoxylate reductase/D-3-phosphoglycerate dehydrogenase